MLQQTNFMITLTQGKLHTLPTAVQTEHRVAEWLREKMYNENTMFKVLRTI